MMKHATLGVVTLAVALAAGFWFGVHFERVHREHWRTVRFGRYTGEVWLVQHVELRDGAYTHCEPVAVVEVGADEEIDCFKGDRPRAVQAARAVLAAIHEVE